MKLNARFALQSFVCLLLSGLFLIPMKGTSQTPINTYALESTDPSTKTDVSAFLVHDADSERYTLTVTNPSQKKLKIYFYANGIKYAYRASLRSFNKPFDLKAADDGVYTFAIQDGKTRLKTDVEIKTIYEIKREIRFPAGSKTTGHTYTVMN